jgi:hypothetical protein
MKRNIRAGFALVSFVVSLLVAGCLGSSLERRTIDVPSFRSWGDQTEQADPDTVIPAKVDVRQRVPELADGSVIGIEEVSLFVQLQNLDATPAEVAVYAHASRITNLAEILAVGIPITKGIAIDGQSAIQIDARNYPFQSANFDAFVDLIKRGDFYLYIVTSADEFNLAANVPSLSLLVTIE